MAMKNAYIATFLATMFLMNVAGAASSVQVQDTEGDQTLVYGTASTPAFLGPGPCNDPKFDAVSVSAAFVEGNLSLDLTFANRSAEATCQGAPFPVYGRTGYVQVDFKQNPDHKMPNPDQRLFLRHDGDGNVLGASLQVTGAAEILCLAMAPASLQGDALRFTLPASGSCTEWNGVRRTYSLTSLNGAYGSLYTHTGVGPSLLDTFTSYTL